MDIEVRFYAHLRDAVGRKTVTREYEGPVTVGDVLADLASEYPDLSGAVFDDDGEIRRTLVVRKNRTTVTEPGAAVEDGDTLAVTPQVVGGGGSPPRPRNAQDPRPARRPRP